MFFQLLYIVSTDDPKWCKEKFPVLNRTFFYTVDYQKDHGLSKRDLDMSIAASCNHTIFDYGTFGFWGAFLAEGYTILAHNMSIENKHAVVENIRSAKLHNWDLIQAFPLSLG